MGGSLRQRLRVVALAGAGALVWTAGCSKVTQYFGSADCAVCTQCHNGACQTVRQGLGMRSSPSSIPTATDCGYGSLARRSMTNLANSR